MRKVFLLTGFNNWGKTWLIEQLFNCRKSFYKSALYHFAGHSFCVIPQSNDDLGGERYEAAYHERMRALADAGKPPDYIISAFCPTKESPKNLSREIINRLYGSDEVFVIPIEYKWCGHAKLLLGEIEQCYSGLANVSIHPLSESDPAKKLPPLQEILKDCLQ